MTIVMTRPDKFIHIVDDITVVDRKRKFKNRISSLHTSGNRRNNEDRDNLIIIQPMTCILMDQLDDKRFRSTIVRAG